MSDLFPVFHTPTFADAAECIPLLHMCPTRCCEYTFANIMLWRHLFHTQIAVCDEAVFVRFNGEQPHYLAPAGKHASRALDTLAAYCAVNGETLMVFGYDDEAAKTALFGREVSNIECFPDEFDYVYRVSDLALLPGSKYHAKRNHIAAFSREYDWRYEEMNDENVADIHLLADRWLAERVALQGDPDGALHSENAAIHELLHHRAAVQLKGAVIRVNTQAVAFTLGAPLCGDTFDTLVEKALSDYAGAYAVINREFAARALGAFEYVNRENDVGLEGLRRAKRSYYPTMMVKKTLCAVRV